VPERCYPLRVLLNGKDCARIREGQEGRDHPTPHFEPKLPQGITVVKGAFCAGRASHKFVRSVISTQYTLQNLRRSCIFFSFIGAVLFAPGLGGEAGTH
jgi:hypothetical protein